MIPPIAEDEKFPEGETGEGEKWMGEMILLMNEENPGL